VLGPEARCGADEDWYARPFPRAQFVYPDHGRLWLTQRTLDKLGGLPLLSRSPRDLIEAVYGEAVSEAIPAGLRRRTDRAEGERLSHRSMAKLNGLDLSRGLTFAAGAWESDTRTPTRLGEETRTVRLARWDGSAIRPWVADADPRRGWRMSEISLRAARVAEAILPETACGSAIEAEVARWPERRFDPPLVLPLVDDKSGAWVGVVKDARGRVVGVAYDGRDGLRFTEL
jgi:CRISPR-associated endonuclease/helicase Cas3